MIAYLAMMGLAIAITVFSVKYIEEKKFVKVTDEQAIKIIHKIAHCKNIAEFQHLEEKQRIKYVQKLKVKGLSVRQISRLTGTGKGLVEKWLKI